MADFDHICCCDPCSISDPYQTVCYAWRIGIIAGGVIYLVLILAGSMYFGLPVMVASQSVFAVGGSSSGNCS